MTSFGDFIKKERELREWTQTDFGAKVGVNSSAVSRIENGTQAFSKNKLELLAKLFNIEKHPKQAETKPTTTDELSFIRIF